MQTMTQVNKTGQIKLRPGPRLTGAYQSSRSDNP